MPTRESELHHILLNNSIQTYLEKLGFQPIREANNRFQYVCPLPGHKETVPSFFVYVNGDYDTFYCFGCSAGYNIVHLVSLIENISYLDAVKKLGGGLEIDSEAELSFLLKRLQAGIQGKINPLDILSKIMFRMNNLCFSYLRWCDFDTEEVRIMKRFYDRVDECIRTLDCEKAQNYGQKLGGLLDKRMEMYRKRKQREELESISSRKVT